MWKACPTFCLNFFSSRIPKGAAPLSTNLKDCKSSVLTSGWFVRKSTKIDQINLLKY